MECRGSQVTQPEPLTLEAPNLGERVKSTGAPLRRSEEMRGFLEGNALSLGCEGCVDFTQEDRCGARSGASRPKTDWEPRAEVERVLPGVWVCAEGLQACTPGGM